MEKAQQQLVEALTGTNNILVTVSNNPSVDSLSAALGLTLLLDKLDKRATAIFSGTIPPAITFLEPDKTFEDTADSLRDFIIALNKDKADHLRYKVEGDVVKIFITPYKTTLTQSDLEFSQGDYNVELVVALGVTSQDNLDKALDAHGKILHDAKVVTVTCGEETSNLGGIDWHDAAASSLSEMVVALSEQLGGDEKLVDEQIATALLTGIVSATDRFSNDHTSSSVMTMAARLMAAGANQQLIAAKLEEGHDIAPSPVGEKTQLQKPSEGTQDDTTKLTIERSEVKAEDKAEDKAVEPTSTVASIDSSDEAEQAKLEKELEGVTKSSAGATLADIEKELKQTGVDNQKSSEDESLVAAKDVSMPGFEPTAYNPPLKTEDTTEQTVATVPVVEPTPSVPDVAVANPVAVPVVPVQAPATITTDHDSIAPDVLTETPPINSIQNEDTSGVVANPFSAPQQAYKEKTLNPIDPNLGGTPEGVAVLSVPPQAPVSDVSAPVVEPTVAPVVPPLEQPAVASNPVQSPGMEVPVLPPLPPLPSLPSSGSVSTPPPPPPPPLPPSFGGQGGVMPAGAVSGDIFGDGSASSPAQPAPSTNGPGVFKIPGQA